MDAATKKPSRMRFDLFDVANVLFMVVLCVIMLVPIVNVLVLSLEPEYIARRADYVHLFPREITLKAYAEIFKDEFLLRSMYNSTFITVIGGVFGTLITGMFAYALTEKKMFGADFLFYMVLVSLVLKPGLMPVYLLVKDLGLLNTLWSLIIPGIITGFHVILMRNFFQSIPKSLKESAHIAGANEIKIFFRIIVPLSTPIIATILLFYSVKKWNLFLQAVMFITDESKKVLQVILRELYNKTVSDEEGLGANTEIGENVKMATTIFAMVPIVCVYPFLQRYFTKGIMLGAIKG
jgi:putative aldouronate transport system permease protein